MINREVTIRWKNYDPDDLLPHSNKRVWANCDNISGLPDYICNTLNGKVWKLDIHHVDYDKQQGCNDIKWLLIPLSRSNHMKIQGELKSFWYRLFIYSLEYDKKYYKEKNIEFNIFEVL